MLKFDSQSHSVKEEVKQLEETAHVHAGKIEATSTAISAISIQSSGLAQRISAQGRELRSQLQDIKLVVKEQTDAIQHDQQTLSALQKQQANTAARTGHHASSIDGLEAKEREAGKKIVSLQSEMKNIARTQEVLQGDVSDVSSQLVSFTKQLSSTVVDVEEVKHSLQTHGKCMYFLLHGIRIGSTIYFIFVAVIESELKMLEPSFFDAEIAYYASKCHPGTRLWIINCVSDWVRQSLSNTSRLHLITANAGMGKSVIASKLCCHFAEQGILAGCFFFQYNKVRRSNPVSVVHTLAYFLCYNVPPFRSEFAKHVSSLTSKTIASCTAAELFTLLILEPIGKLTLSDVKVFVIDALDECDCRCHSEMVRLILREFTKLPKWLSVIITSRADENIRKLKQIRPRIHLDPQDQQNLSDITHFLKSILADRVDPSSLHDAVGLLVKKSEGLFLYFHYSVQLLLEMQAITIPLLEELLPEGIDDYYSQNFERLHAQLQHHYQPLLSALVAARSGVPTEIIPDLLNCSSQVCSELVRALSVIFPISNGIVQLFHASIRDWVTDPEEAEEHVVSVRMGHQSLAKYIKTKLHSLINSCPVDNDILSNPLAIFVIKNATYHGAEIQAFSVDICQWLTDIQFLYYRSLVSHGITDLLQDFDQAKSILHLVPLALQQSTKNCEAFIRKHMEILHDNPLYIFQLALNEGGMLYRKISESKVGKDPKSVFHRLKCVLLQNKPYISPGLVTSISLPLPAKCCTISSDETVVTACGDTTGMRGTLCLWKWKSEIDSPLEFDLGREVKCCDISSDQKLIACGGLSNIYNFSGGKVIMDNNNCFPARNCSLFSPKMDSFLCWDSRCLPYFTNIVELWSLKDYSRVILEETKDQGRRTLSACYSSDGSLAITAHAEGSLKVWNCHTGELQRLFCLPDLYPCDANTKPVDAGPPGVTVATDDLSNLGYSFTVSINSESPLSTADAFKSIFESTKTEKPPEKLGQLL